MKYALVEKMNEGINFVAKMALYDGSVSTKMFCVRCYGEAGCCNLFFIYGL